MRRFVDWFRWEFGRPLEVTGFIRFITVERFIKAGILVAGGIVLLVVSSRADLQHFATDAQNQLNLTPGSGWWQRAFNAALARFGALPRRKEQALAAGAILYGALEAAEGIGLLLRRRWAEYLVLLATAAFLPLEVTEIAHKATPFKVGALLVNIAIIVYLIWRKRLFLERPGHVRADRTEEYPSGPH